MRLNASGFPRLVVSRVIVSIVPDKKSSMLYIEIKTYGLRFRKNTLNVSISIQTMKNSICMKVNVATWNTFRGINPLTASVALT